MLSKVPVNYEQDDQIQSNQRKRVNGYSTWTLPWVFSLGVFNLNTPLLFSEQLNSLSSSQTEPVFDNCFSEDASTFRGCNLAINNPPAFSLQVIPHIHDP